MHWGRVTSFIILVGAFLFCQSLAHAQTSCEITPEDSCKFSDIYFYDTHYDAKGFSVLFSNFHSEHPFRKFKVRFSNDDGAVHTQEYGVGANPSDESYVEPLTYVNRIEFEIFDFLNPLPGAATELSFATSGSIIGFLEQTDSPEPQPVFVLPKQIDSVLNRSQSKSSVSQPDRIRTSQLTPSSTLKDDGTFLLEQLRDGITDDAPPHNGFATWNQQGTIRFDLDKAYRISSFKIWNDINVRSEGIKSFELEFYDDSNVLITSRGPYETVSGKVEMQQFQFTPIANVSRIDLSILNVHTAPNYQRIEIREVEFVGVVHEKNAKQIIQQDLLIDAKDSLLIVNENLQKLTNDWASQKEEVTSRIDHVVQLDNDVKKIIENLKGILPNSDASGLISKLNDLGNKRNIGSGFKTESQDSIALVDDGLRVLSNSVSAMNQNLNELSQTFLPILNPTELTVATNKLTENMRRTADISVAQQVLAQGVQELNAGLLNLIKLDNDIAEFTALKTEANALIIRVKRERLLKLIAVGIFAGLLIGGGLFFRNRNSLRLENNKILKSNKIDPDYRRHFKTFVPLLALTPNLSQTRESSDRKPSDPPLQAGMLFDDSPMIATSVPSSAVAAPAGSNLGLPAGHNVPVGLQNLTGEYKQLQNAYLATGRIGLPQDGMPEGKDQSMGTGFLIRHDLVMTNHHVYYWNEDELAAPGTEYGIEFLGEKGNPESDFRRFDGNPPIIYPELDIVVFRLLEPIDRVPLDRVAIPTQTLNEREIAVVGYPKHKEGKLNPDFPMDKVILDLVEDNPIFAIKRISLGKIFRHKDNQDDQYGIVSGIPHYISPKEEMLAICHKASTMGGNSGSPILDVATGELLGVHYSGIPTTDYDMRENLAMAIEWIINSEPAIDQRGDNQKLA